MLRRDCFDIIGNQLLGRTRMNKVAFGICLLLASFAVLAQQDLVGKYSGRYVSTGGSVRSESSVGVTLEITAVEGATVHGKMNRFGNPTGGRQSPCNGEYMMEGRLKGDQLT